MMSPFNSSQIGKPSYGLGSFGYDIMLGNMMYIPKPNENCAGEERKIMDPLDFSEDVFEKIYVYSYFDIMPNSFILAESVEKFDMPNDICGVVWGKSTYARCGLLVNVTPLEPGWKGILTMELANVGHLPIRIHIKKGIAQVVFFRGQRPERTYTEKESGGVYQNQTGVTTPK